MLWHQTARIPVAIDDYALHTGDCSYAEWKRNVLVCAQLFDHFVIGLHDCYAEHWIDDYPRLMDELAEYGSPVTLDGVSDRLFLAECV